MFNKAKAIKLSAKQMDKQLLFNGVYPQLIHKLIPLYSKILKNTNNFKEIIPYYPILLFIPPGFDPILDLILANIK